MRKVTRYFLVDKKLALHDTQCIRPAFSFREEVYQSEWRALLAGTSPAAAAFSSACTRAEVEGCVLSMRPSRPKNRTTPSAPLVVAAAEGELLSESGPPEIIVCAIRPAAAPLARRSAGARAAAASIWHGMARIRRGWIGVAAKCLRGCNLYQCRYIAHV